MVNAFGPSDDIARPDPLALLTAVARREHAGQERQPILSSLTGSPRTDPDMPGDRHGGPVDAMAETFQKLGTKMQRVWAVLADDDTADVPMRGQYRHPVASSAGDVAPRIPAEARSFIIEQMRKVQDAPEKKAGIADDSAAVAALVDSDTERGGRLTGAAVAVQALAASGGRVAQAFDLTR